MEIGIAERAKAGSPLSGDAHRVVEQGQYVLVAIADGLGSGEKAARSARLAVQGVAEFPTEALQDILAYCHYTILAAGGVGVMMALLRLDTLAHRLEFSGVGNVRFQAHSREPIQPIVRYGYLGVRLPSLHVYRSPYTPGDVFVLHTDGVSTRFHLHNHLSELRDGAQSLAERILGQYGKDHDDATVIVVRA